MNNEIINKVDEIIDLINNSSSYQKYIKIKKDLKNNKEIMLLINEIKVLQKDIVHHLKNDELLKEKEKELEGIPLYREYKNTLDDINNTYNIIENTLNNYFNKTLN